MEKLLTTKELAEATGLSEYFINQEVREGKLKAVKLGNRNRYREKSIDEWLSAKEEAEPQKRPRVSQ